ncbi:MAG: cobyric acid synthase, partial [Tannerellaceae bacterium]
ETDAPFAILGNGEKDGYYLNDKTWGTYIHGVFDNNDVIAYILKQVEADICTDVDYKARKDANYDKLADWVRAHIDMEYVYKTLEV